MTVCNPTAAELAANNAASESDRLWFIDNSRRKYRIRRMIPGEFCEYIMPDGSSKRTVFVVVRNLRPGYRQRGPVVLPFPHARPPDNDKTARKLLRDYQNVEHHGILSVVWLGRRS